MSEYEATAYQSLEGLKLRHDREIMDFNNNYITQNQIKYTFSRELMDMRDLERKYRAMKDYGKADQCKKEGD